MAPLVALVTGCSEPNGIGAALALELLAQGFRVFATARKVETMQGLKEKGCETLALDVTDEASIKAAAFKVAQKTEGKLNILVNNAGAANVAPLLDVPLSTLRGLLEVNVVGLLAATQAFAPLLVNATVAKQKSLVLNLGSTASMGIPWNGAYSASKAAANCLSDVLMIELEPLGVKVVTLHPGRVLTPMTLNDAPSVSAFVPPTASYYASSWEKVHKAHLDMMAGNNSKSPTAREFARGVVKHILKSEPKGELWAGNGAWMMKNIIPLLPFSALVGARRSMSFTQFVGKPTTREIGVPAGF